MKKIWFMILLCMILAACAANKAPSKLSYDNSERLELRTAAEKGDREAQYRLGNSYCCGDTGGFWDTREAVKWWCRAAAQGQKEAEAAIARNDGKCAP